ncbi:MAG: hypothetical protein HY883_02800 [Deltaproteobacteria bacterium]|nr:hypothetical protein [Deltaproteobacteria bacterium]
MSLKDRIDLIKKVEKYRESRLICYVTGDRQPFATKIADDVIPIFERHLQKIGYIPKISLFLYTRGGDMLTPLRLVKLMRNYCQYFEVVVPYRAHSAGTLIALGADNIAMGKVAELSPVDPTTAHPFNPKNPANPNLPLEISVEDVNSYLLFAKEKAGVKDEQMSGIYSHLTTHVHPLAIGNVYRGYRMSKMLTERLLKIHMNAKNDAEKIKSIIDNLTGLICIHHYPIMRDEVKELGLNITELAGDEEKTVWQLYNNYAMEMKLENPYTPVEELGDLAEKDFSYYGAYIESLNISDVFVHRGKLQKVQQPVPGQIGVNINFQSQRWETV